MPGAPTRGCLFAQHRSGVQKFAGFSFQIPIDNVGIYGIIPTDNIGYNRRQREMLISSKGSYALRIMLELARQPAGVTVSLRTLAERQNLSRKYLESIMTSLCKASLVQSSAGKDGGYCLLRPASAYTAGEILRAAQGPLTTVCCFAAKAPACNRNCLCETHAFWQGLAAQIDDYLEKYTLAQLLLSSSLPEKNDTYKKGDIL